MGLAVAPGSLHPVAAFTALLCIAVGAGAAGALNMWYDADVDALMTRTARRPVPMGRVRPGEALAFGLTLGSFAVVMLGLLVNWVAAALLAFTIFFYVVIYTIWLKRSTPQNIVIGGAAGAFPPMIGWAAVDRLAVSRAGAAVPDHLLLDAAAFLGARALSHRRLRPRRRIPMLPVVAGDASTRRQIMLYTLILVPLGVAPWALGYTGALYGRHGDRDGRDHGGARLAGFRVNAARRNAPAAIFLPSRSCICFCCSRCCWSNADGAG